MDLHCTTLLEEFKDSIKIYQKLENVLQNSLDEIVKELGFMVNTVETRVKTFKSFEGKLELKGHKYSKLKDVTDLVGGRIVTFYSDQVDKVAGLIEKKFIVDWNNSIDKGKGLSLNQFGYKSLHYICRIPETLFYDENYPEINQIPFEIQIRTILQHTWASINHDFGYKKDIEVPQEYLRNMSRIAGLLEMVDEEFIDIKHSIENYRRNIKLIVKNGDLKGVDLNSDSFNEYLKNEPFEKLIKRVADINNMEIEHLKLNNFLSVFKILGLTTLLDVHNLIENYSDLTYQFAVRLYTGRDFDIISSYMPLQILCSVYIIKNNLDPTLIEQFMGVIYGSRNNKERFKDKMLEIAALMGINKKN